MREEHLATRASIREPLGRRLLRNGPWLALGLAAVLWAGRLGGVFWSDASADGLLERVEAVCEERERALEGRTFPLEAQRRRLDELVGRLDEQGVPAPAIAVDAGLFAPEGFLEAVRAGTPNVIVFLPPRDVVAEGAPGRIEVRWIADADGNVPPAGWIVSRASPGEQERTVARLPRETLRWVDEDVRPGELYRYRVRAFTEDEALLLMGVRRTLPSAVAEARAATDAAIELMAVLEDGRVRLRVRKLGEDPPPEQIVEVGEGDPVGRVDPGTGIDFGTGFVFRALESSVERREVEREVPVFDDEGKVELGPGGAPRMVRLKTTRTWDVRVVRLEQASGRVLQLTQRTKR